LLLQRLQPAGEGKINAVDFIAAGRIKPGDRFI